MSLLARVVAVPDQRHYLSTGGKDPHGIAGFVDANAVHVGLGFGDHGALVISTPPTLGSNYIPYNAPPHLLTWTSCRV